MNLHLPPDPWPGSPPGPPPQPAPQPQYDEAVRENWARGRVAAAGKSWTTHMAKFSGAVLPRSR